ncbi:MAG TPA: hypothetical protein GX507_03105 [Clostridia bacterium]|nr:hypothetical protein [Clostridia bacterium]
MEPPKPRRLRTSASLRRGLATGLVTFVVAVGLAFPSEHITRTFSLSLSLFLLALIIGAGIFFDVIGIATAVADEAPLHAMAAKKVRGAREGLRLVRYSEKVTSFCNDIVGDICGTVSGALGAAIVFQIERLRPDLNEAVVSVVMVGVVAGLTVGGKAAAKGIGINDAEEIVRRVGIFLNWIEKYTGFSIIGPKGSPRQRRTRRN